MVPFLLRDVSLSSVSAENTFSIGPRRQGRHHRTRSTSSECLAAVFSEELCTMGTHGPLQYPRSHNNNGGLTPNNEISKTEAASAHQMPTGQGTGRSRKKLIALVALFSGLALLLATKFLANSTLMLIQIAHAGTSSTLPPSCKQEKRSAKSTSPEPIATLAQQKVFYTPQVHQLLLRSAAVVDL